MDDDGTLRSINVVWIELWAHSIIGELPKTWRFVHTSPDIINESIAKAANGQAGPSVSIETGDCVLNP
jgi:hypothetical protein